MLLPQKHNHLPYLYLSTILAGVLIFFLNGCNSGVYDYAPTPCEIWEPQHPCEALSVGQQFVCETTLVQFGDEGSALGLDKLIDAGLSHNPQTRNAWFLSKAAAARLGESYAPYYPIVDTNADVSYLKQRNMILQGTLESGVINGGLRISYLLYNFGKRESDVESAKELLYSLNYQYNQTFQDLILSITTSYYSLVAANESLKASQATLKDSEIAYENAKESLKQGVGTRQDELRAYASVKNAQASIQKNLASIETSKATLAKAIGVDIRKEVNIEVVEWDDSAIGAVNQKVGDLLDEALKVRPALLSEYSNLLSLEHNIDSIKSEFYPSFLINTEGSVFRVFERSFNPTSVVEASLQLKWNVFDGFNTTYRLLEAQENKCAKQELIKAAQLEVMSEVWSYYYTYNSALGQLDAAKASLDASEEAFNAIQLAYQVGSTDIVELLQALSEIANAREFYVTSKANVFITLAHLAHAVGNYPNNLSTTRKIL